MAKCAAITAAGSACKGVPMPGEAYCYVHHPDTKEERRRHGSKGGRRGGRGRPSPISAELTRLQAVFEDLAQRIEQVDIDRSRAAVAFHAYNGARDCLASMLKAKELEELEERIVELEERYQHENGARTYGGFRR